MMMNITRNGPLASAIDVKAPCDFDVVYAADLNVAENGAITLTFSPQWSRYFLPQYISIAVVGTADATANGRALIQGARIKQCDMFQSAGTAEADGGIVAPDFFDQGDCCYGMPICWGAFGKESDSAELTIVGLNITSSAVDVHASLFGRAVEDLPAGWNVGRRCGVR